MPDPLMHLFVLAIPVACVARTVTAEEVFREPREYCKRRCDQATRVMERKFFYLFTCEYCFSHWVTIGLLAITNFRLLYDDWRGLLVSFFSLVFVSNCYLAFYSRIRVDIASGKAEAEIKKRDVQLKEKELQQSKPVADPNDKATTTPGP